jgi:Uncharacterized protein conserved in bacteria
MEDQKDLLKKINELAHKAKDGTITKEEEDQQAQLRKEYLKNFREGFRSQIEMMRVFDKKGMKLLLKKFEKFNVKRDYVTISLSIRNFFCNINRCMERVKHKWEQQ